MAADHVLGLRDNGYAVVRGFLDAATMAEVAAAADRVQAEALKHHATWRDRNLLYEIVRDPIAGARIVVQAHWFSWIEPVLERQRRHPRYLDVLEPLLGRDIKQVANQIHWKPPGAKYTSYRFHQDARFREDQSVFDDLAGSYLNTGLAIDRQDASNGGLRVFPGSHRLGYLRLSDDGPIMVGQTQDEELRRAGLDPAAAVTLALEPGDLAIWTLYTVHGSSANTSAGDRRFMINGYVRAYASPQRGEWAFRDGVSTPLGAQPEICKYEKLRERPGPFYVEDDWTGEGAAGVDPAQVG